MIKIPNIKITKKRIIIAIVALGIVILFLITRNVGEDESFNNQAQPTPTFQELPEDLTFEDIPSSRIIEVNGVSMNNFFIDDDPNKAKYESIITDTENYTISYQNRLNKFLILIKGSPFFRHRTLAEVDFLETLGIEKEEACNLNVEIRTPHFANPEQASNTYGLSFCN